MRLFGKKKHNVINNCDINMTGSNVTFNGRSFSQNCVKGSGNAKTIVMAAKPFNRANIAGSVDVDFVMSKSEQVIEVTADDNLIDFVEILYSGDSISISFKDGASFSTCQPIKVNITCPVLDDLKLTGSSDVTVSKMNQEKLNVNIVGSAYITLDGKAGDATFKIKGSADIDAKDLQVDNLEVSISGSGNVKATAKKIARTRISGSGKIKVYGKPNERSSECNGSGKIKFK